MKPPYISHYLVLRDLIAGIDPRQFSDTIHYLTSRVENIKCDLKDKGLKFNEDARAFGTYAPYKPYVLIQNVDNLECAKALLETYTTPEVLAFLSRRHEIQESRY